MDFPWLTIWMEMAGMATMLAVLLSVQSWEHRRFARGRIRKPMDGPTGRVALFVPCKGLDLELEQNLHPLLMQDHGNYEVVFVVECATDAALPIIQRVIASHPEVSARVVEAGLAENSGQKVHNLLAATASLSPDIEYLAFADSDARPGNTWLRTLMQRMDRRADAATGYRWFIPQQATITNDLLASINGTVAAMFGPGGHHLVWGGAWTVRRDVFETSGLRDAWRGTLSDDLVAARVLQRDKRHVEFEPGCMVASPLQVNWRQMFRFVRRQYIIGKVHARMTWLMGLAGITVSVLAFWGGLAVLFTGLLTTPFSWNATLPPAMFCLFWYSLAAIRGRMRRDLALACLPEHHQTIQRTSRIDIWAAPLVSLIHWLLILSSVWGRTIAWRGNTYWLGRHGKVRLLHRAVDKSSLVPPNDLRQRIDASHPGATDMHACQEPVRRPIH